MSKKYKGPLMEIKIVLLNNGTALVNGRTIHKDGTVIGLKGKPLVHNVSHKDGYLRVSIFRSRYITLHRLLALCFIPNPEGLETVNHKDGNKLNNSLDNLEWVSRADNLYHAMDAGRHPKARRAVRNNVGDIFKSSREAARHFGIHHFTISRAIKKGHNCGGMKWEYA